MLNGEDIQIILTQSMWKIRYFNYKSKYKK